MGVGVATLCALAALHLTQARDRAEHDALMCLLLAGAMTAPIPLGATLGWITMSILLLATVLGVVIRVAGTCLMGGTREPYPAHRPNLHIVV
jgi:hypothetical protein